MVANDDSEGEGGLDVPVHPAPTPGENVPQNLSQSVQSLPRVEPVQSTSSASVPESATGFTLQQQAAIQIMLKAAIDNDRKFRDQIQSSSSSTTTIMKVKSLDEEDSEVDKQVSRSKFIQTSTAIVTSITALKITSKSDKFTQMRLIKSNLQQTGLATMVNGHRKKPKSTPGNIFGYRAKHIYSSNSDEHESGESCSVLSEKSAGISSSPTDVVVEADDLSLWNHDYARLMCLIPCMFSADILYYAAGNIRESKSVEAFVEIHNHLFGTKTRDIETARQAVQQFSLRYNEPIRREIERWEQLFLNVESAEDRAMTEKDKKHFLITHLFTDKVPMIIQISVQTSLNDPNNQYRDIIHNLKLITDELPIQNAMKLAKTTIRPAGKKGEHNDKNDKNNNTSKKPCFDFINGKCNRGDSCKFSHATKYNKPDNKNSNDKKEKNDTPIPLTKDYRSYKTIGPGRGSVTDQNPFGYSKPQIAQIAILESFLSQQSEPPSTTQYNSPANFRSLTIKRTLTDADLSDSSDQDPHPLPLSACASDLVLSSDSDDASETSEVITQNASSANDSVLSDDTENLSETSEVLTNTLINSKPQLQYNEISQSEFIRESPHPLTDNILTDTPIIVERVNHREPHQRGHPSGPNDERDTEIETYRRYNMDHIAQNMFHILHMADDTDLPCDRQVVQGYHIADEYYSDNPLLVREYQRDNQRASIEPCKFMIRKGNDNEATWQLHLYGFGDISNEFVSHNRRDIVNITARWMHLMFRLGEVMCRAIVYYPKPMLIMGNIHPCPINQMYNPTKCYLHDNPSYTPGHYWSMAYDMNDHITLIKSISQMELYNQSSRRTNLLLADTLLHSVVYDFIAYVSQCLGYEVTEFSLDKIAYIRYLLMTDLRKVQCTEFTNTRLHGVFEYIIMNSTVTYDLVKPCSLSHKHQQALYDYFKNRSTHSRYYDYENFRQTCNITKFYNYSLVSHSFNAVKSTSNRMIVDTGASVCATSDPGLLTNIRPCVNMVACPAFGPEIRPTSRGDFGRLNLDTLVIDSMPDTLISVSQLCQGGKSNKQNIAIFSTEGVRVFTMDSIKHALQLIHVSGVEVLKGYVSDGIYITDPKPNNKHSIYLAQFKPVSLYDHVHMVTGHPGEKGMQWHKENSLNSKFDENVKSRSVCKGCVYGSLASTPTDHFREHRPLPVIPGQCFSLDAYTHGVQSTRGNYYCDIYTDLATRRCYPVFTKDRSAHELCEKSKQLFMQNPQWVTDSSAEVRRFIRLDAESNYRSIEFLTFASSIGYTLERTPVRDKHAGGIAERAVGVISAKTNIAMMAPVPHVPNSFWDYAMAYACDTQSYNYSSVIGTSPYMKITGKPINIKYLQPFWSSCYVYIPVKDRAKVGAPRAYKARFVGYANTTLLFPNYIVIPVNERGQYQKCKDSKNVIFDPTIDFDVYTPNEEPYDDEFLNTDHYIPFLNRSIPEEVHVPVSPERTYIPKIVQENKQKREEILDTDETINTFHEPYEDIDGSPVYWYSFYVRNYEYPLIMCETQHYYKTKVVRDPRVPSNYYNAITKPQWADAISKELDKFEKNLCLQIVPYNGQHLVPMMWTFVIKTDGTKKARLVGRGDLMLPYVDFDPNAVYCGNVTACSIKMCLTIAAKYKLTMKGGDLEGAYLVTRSNSKYNVYIKTPQGYSIPNNTCIQAIGNLYGFPPAGQNFSIEFDKCLTECGYLNTSWDLKFFYKWVNGKPVLVIAHSDDFRWFGPVELITEWEMLVQTFEAHKYKVSDATDNEFVGIKITRDEKYNYHMHQTRMIDEILAEMNMKNAADAYLPYPLGGEPLSKQDNATEQELPECSKYPYRRIVGQLMYGMVHTLVTIVYALNVLSRYSNNPGPRHIAFLKHLLRYVRTTKTDQLRFSTHDGPTDLKTMTDILQLRFQCDADLAGNPDTLHSQTAYLGYLADNLICWCSTDQGSIATSTAESELKAINHTLKCEVIANRGILNTMGWIQSPTVIEEDNKAVVDASVVPHMTRGLRHIAITQNFIKEKVADNTCVVVKIESKNNNADIGTKRLPRTTFEYLAYPLTDKSLRKIKE
jgi:hypothetical protein